MEGQELLGGGIETQSLNDVKEPCRDLGGACIRQSRQNPPSKACTRT